MNNNCNLLKLTSFSKILVLVAACYLISAIILNLVLIPWAGILLLSISIGMVIVFFNRDLNLAFRLMYMLSPFAILLCSVYISVYLTALLAGIWMIFLAQHSISNRSFVLQHFGAAILMFLMFDMLILKHGMVEVKLIDWLHAYSSLVRNAFNRGYVVGPSPLGIRLLVGVHRINLTKNDKNISRICG